MASQVVDFEYGYVDKRGAGTSSFAANASGLTLSILSDRAYLRAELAEDAELAGIRIARSCGLEHLKDRPLAVPGDILFVDCPREDDVACIGLDHFGEYVTRYGTQLVVMTSMDAVDSVCGSLPGNFALGEAQVLVAPSRGERLIALANAMSHAGNRVRELSLEDRFAVLRLAEQVSQIAGKLEKLTGGPDAVAEQPAAFRFSTSIDRLRTEPVSDRALRTVRPPLPDPRLVRRIIRQRQARARFFESELFADPAWDMLLDLTAARAEHLRVAVSSLCIASGVPTSTALRWIGQLIDAGLLERVNDEADRRRAFITLTDKAADSMARYFADLGPTATTMV